MAFFFFSFSFSVCLLVFVPYIYLHLCIPWSIEVSGGEKSALHKKGTQERDTEREKKGERKA
jgi:hypothetical protein